MTLINRHPNAYVDVDTHKTIPFLHTGSTVVMQSKIQDPGHMEHEQGTDIMTTMTEATR